LIAQALPLVVSAAGVAAVVFAAGAAVSVARFYAAGLPWEQAVNAATESDIRAVGLIWILLFILLGIFGVTLAYVASPHGRATPAMYYALIGIATAEAAGVWYLGKGEGWRVDDDQIIAGIVLVGASVAATLVVFAAHVRHWLLVAASAATLAALGTAVGWQLTTSDPGWAITIVISVATGLVAALLLMFAARRAPWNRRLRSEPMSERQKRTEPRLHLSYRAFLLLAVIGVGSGVAIGLLFGKTWVGVCVILTGALGLLTIRVAEVTKGFRWYGVVVFLAVPLFGAVVGALRMIDEPRLQPTAFLLEDRGRYTAIEGIYVGQSEDQLWFASIALDNCDGQAARRGSGRLRSVPSKQVSALTIGPEVGLPKLAREARAMRDAVRAEHRGRVLVAGPSAVRGSVPLDDVNEAELERSRWVTLGQKDLGRHPTLTLNGRRLRMRQKQGGAWQIRLPRLARSGAVYADCGEQLNPSFLTVPRRPLAMATATAVKRNTWSLSARGSVDPDGQIDRYRWILDKPRWGEDARPSSGFPPARRP